MNETEFIREQVRTERRHMAEVRQALDAALAANGDSVGAVFVRAAAKYLVFIVQRFNAQDSLHCEQLQRFVSAGAGVSSNDAVALTALDDLALTLRRSAAAIEQLQLALVAVSATVPASDAIGDAALRAACESYLQFYRTELARRSNALYPLLERHYSAADWRRASLVDAESILQERELYDAVRASLPMGVELKSSGRPAPATASSPR